MSNRFIQKVDWLTIALYLLLVACGWLNIYSATSELGSGDYLNFSTLYGKQLFFMLSALVLIVLILAVEAKMYARFAGLIYLLSLLSLLGLFVFGKTISGATSWYSFAGFSLQPSEFAKTAAVLALAKYLSDIQTNLKITKHQLYAVLIVLVPAVLIVPQPDPGSALVFFALFYVLYQVGQPSTYLGLAFLAVAIFVATLLYGFMWVSVAAGIIFLVGFVFLKGLKKKVKFLPFFLIFALSVAISFSTNWVYNDVFKQRHRDRLGLWLRLEKDPERLKEIRKTIGYNTWQSEQAIASGGPWGKGYLEGTLTKGNFIPEQHTDFIFTTVAEEWGFAGSSLVILLFSLLLLRLLILIDRQKSKFSRIYGYGLFSILFVHYVINIGMVIGLLPTVGIPLPFFSYGGSSLWGFTLLLFIFIKLDGNRYNDWMS